MVRCSICKLEIGSSRERRHCLVGTCRGVYYRVGMGHIPPGSYKESGGKKYAMKISLAQIDSVWESKKDNFVKAEDFISRASAASCEIIFFPEMFATGFSMNTSATGESITGETVQFVSSMARRYRIQICAGYIRKLFPGRDFRNCAIVVDAGGKLIAEYSKMHLFSLSDENRIHSAGDVPLVFRLGTFKASVFICYDLRFPEIFRKVASSVQAIFVIANWPSKRQDHWETLLKARAIENQCYVAGVNRVGTDGNMVAYAGGSVLYGPSGNE
ncbi:MAG: hypothetical protein GF350_06775, partial [Chitinivibrionales bacterium]|nr:hypothetical protein [Chitinivibrionales bacterium]